MDKEEILYVLPSIRYALLFAEFGKLYDLIALGYTKVSDGDYEIFWDVLHVTMDFVAADFIEDYEINTWYFSDRNMMEFYRLCRVYSSGHHTKLSENPYMREAQRYVESCMDFGDYYGYGWRLQTKINHKWASGIVFHSDCEFCGEFELVTALLEIQEWYKDAADRLRGKLLEEHLLCLPALPESKEELI